MDEVVSSGRGNDRAPQADEPVEEKARFSDSLLRCVKGIPQAYLSRVVRCPCCLLVVMQLCVALICGVMWNGWDLNTDFDDFLRASTGASLRYDAVGQAWSAGTGEPAEGERRLSTVSYKHTLLTLAYYKEDGGNLLEEENMLAILHFERFLQANDAWSFACGLEVTSQEFSSETNLTSQLSCTPGESFVNMVWPSHNDGLNGIAVNVGGKQRLEMDGSGNRFLPPEAVLAGLRDVPSKHDRLSRFFPKDFVAPEGGQKAHTDVMRSFFLFSESIGDAGYYKSNYEATAAREHFFNADLHSLLNHQHEEMRERGIRVFYSNGVLDQADIFSALLSDILLSVAGLVVVFLLICGHTRSLWLSCIGSFLVLECMPLGYVFFRHFSGLPKLSIVNCVSTFVIIGVGSDLVFVLTDAWRQSAQNAKPIEQEDDPDEELDQYEKACRMHERLLQGRLVWVYSNAGVSCLTTGLCGASSFLVNLMSVLMPLREFGLFMGLCCIFAVFLELVMYPIALVVYESRLFKKRLNQQEREDEGQNISGVVVPSDAQVVPVDMVDQVAGSKGRSFLMRFFAGFWSDCIQAYNKWVLGAFALLGLISMAGIAVSLKVDGTNPVIFPPSHNQVKGQEVLQRFDTAVQVAAGTALEKAYMCDVAAEEEMVRPDIIAGCSSFASIGYCHNHFQGTMTSQCSTACGFTGYCLATWCPVDVAPNASKSEPGRCDCYQANTAGNLDPSQPGVVRFETSVVGFQAEDWPQLEPYFRQLFLEMAAPGTGLEQDFSYRAPGRGDDDTWSASPTAPNARWEAPYVQQHWRSGTISTWHSFEAPRFSVRSQAAGASSEDPLPEITVEQKCFCDGVQPCSSWSAQKQTVYHSLHGPNGSSVDVSQGGSRRVRRVSTEVAEHLPGELEGLSWPRRLQATPATIVSVVWGLKVKVLGPFDLFVEPATEQLWAWDTTFDPADPWAQRSMMRVAENMPEDLHLISTNSWLQGFESWLVSAGLEFPARDFHGAMETYMNGLGGGYRKNILRDESKRVVALTLEFSIDASLGDGLEWTTATRSAWERYIRNCNAVASLRANKAFQVSKLWVNVEAQEGILQSTATTISTALILGYVAAVVFTQDFLLSLFPMLSVLLTVMCLLFTMVGILQWEFGPVDVIALIVFLGYMFTFNLHVAQYYNHAKLFSEQQEDQAEYVKEALSSESEDRALLRRQERFGRVQHALTCIGQSLICSASTTAASAIFLLCCTLQFFVKFGAVILSVTILSVLHSLLFLPCLLILCGPTSTSCACLRQAAEVIREKISPTPAEPESEEPERTEPGPPVATVGGPESDLDGQEKQRASPLPEKTSGEVPPLVGILCDEVAAEVASPKAAKTPSYVRQMDSHEEEV